MKTEEAPLLPRVAAGDSDAVQECIDRYGSLVWSLARRSLRDATQAEDAVQEIFIAVWRAAGRFDAERSSESTFIATIARRRLIDRFRRKAARAETESIEDLALPTTDDGLARVESSDEACRAAEVVQRLEPQLRKLLELWVVGGMTHAEIATSTGIPLGTVKSQIRRGLARVREKLGGQTLVSSPEASA